VCPEGIEPSPRPSQGRMRTVYTTDTVNETVPRPGVEPGTPRSKREAISDSPGQKRQKRSARGSNPLLLSTNEVCRRATPADQTDSDPGWNRTILDPDVSRAPSPDEPRDQTAEMEGFEPSSRGLEPRSSPRRTPLKSDRASHMGCKRYPSGKSGKSRGPESNRLDCL
jgi:hypothetical protein